MSQPGREHPGSPAYPPPRLGVPVSESPLPAGGEAWEAEDTKPCMEALDRGLPALPSLPGLPGLYLSCIDMLLTEDSAWLVKVSEAAPTLAVPPEQGGGQGGGQGGAGAVPSH